MGKAVLLEFRPKALDVLAVSQEGIKSHLQAPVSSRRRDELLRWSDSPQSLSRVPDLFSRDPGIRCESSCRTRHLPFRTGLHHPRAVHCAPGLASVRFPERYQAGSWSPDGTRRKPG